MMSDLGLLSLVVRKGSRMTFVVFVPTAVLPQLYVGAKISLGDYTALVEAIKSEGSDGGECRVEVAVLIV